MIKSQPDNLQNIAKECIPGLITLMAHAIALPEDRGNSLMIPLLGLVAALRDNGVDVNPSNVFAQMFVALRTSQGSKGGNEQRET
jgi:hypothetical protein